MNHEFRQLRLSQLDRHLSNARGLPPRPSSGWIAATREALGLTLKELGQVVRVARQNVQKFERAEADDRITLATLRRLAEAMGCDLVYSFVPKSGTFAELAEHPTRERAMQDVKQVVHTMALEDQKPENAEQLLEDEVQRRLNAKSK